MADDYSYDSKAIREDQEALRLSGVLDSDEDTYVDTSRSPKAMGIEEGGNEEGYTPTTRKYQQDDCLPGMNNEAEKEVKKFLIQKEINSEQKSYNKTGLAGIASTFAGAIIGEIVNYKLAKYGVYSTNYINEGASIIGLAMSTPGIAILIGNYVNYKRNIKELRTKLSELEK